MRNLVIIPAFNEEHSISIVLQGLSQLPEGYEILVVDDGSTDRTSQIASFEAARLNRPCTVVSLSYNAGIGVAVQTGYRFAAFDGGYEYVIQVDGDGQHDPSFIVSMVETCRIQFADLCIGSRFLEGDETGDRSTAGRRIGIGMLRLMIRILTGTRISDPTSGFRCAGKNAWRRFALLYPDDYPEPEAIMWCLRNNLRLIEVPVRMNARAGGRSSIGTIAAAYYMGKVLCSLVIDRIRRQEVIS